MFDNPFQRSNCYTCNILQVLFRDFLCGGINARSDSRQVRSDLSSHLNDHYVVSFLPWSEDSYPTRKPILVVVTEKSFRVQLIVIILLNIWQIIKVIRLWPVGLHTHITAVINMKYQYWSYVSSLLETLFRENTSLARRIITGEQWKTETMPQTLT